MERRHFIALTGLSTLGLLAGSNLFASVFKEVNHELIEIKPPTIHVRHGVFNLQTTRHNGIKIQRDIFNRDGLSQISHRRIVSIKISDSNKETFGISEASGFRSESNKLTALKLIANKTISINIDSPSAIVSEFEEIYINTLLVNNNQAFVQYSKAETRILSNYDQSIFIYKLKQ